MPPRRACFGSANRPSTAAYAIGVEVNQPLRCDHNSSAIIGASRRV